MKRKNVIKGEFIVAKNKHGGAGLGDVVTAGQGYRVNCIESEPYFGNLFCAIQVEDNDMLWVDQKHFRKQK